MCDYPDNENESSALLQSIFQTKPFYKHFLVDANRTGKELI